MVLLEEKGYLGNRILNSDFSFRLRIKEGAGAFGTLPAAALHRRAARTAGRYGNIQ